MEARNENVELFAALSVAEVEARTQHVSGYACSPNSATKTIDD